MPGLTWLSGRVSGACWARDGGAFRQNAAKARKVRKKAVAWRLCLLDDEPGRNMSRQSYLPWYCGAIELPAPTVWDVSSRHPRTHLIRWPQGFCGWMEIGVRSANALSLRDLATPPAKILQQNVRQIKF